MNVAWGSLFLVFVVSLAIGVAVVALVAFALVTIATRKATVFHIAALVQIDNALAVAALAASGGLPGLIELGVAADLIVVVLVAALLHARIYAEFGSGDPLPTHTWMIATQGDLAVAVFVEVGESGSKTAGPILERFLRTARG